MHAAPAALPDRLPPRDCPLCPRLVAYRHANQAAHPDWFNGPVPCFGSRAPRLLVVGLAPGVAGANRTGRPFTGDHAGMLLYQTLIRFGFAEGRYEASPDDGLTLVDCRIANAVRCVPPANLPKGIEISTCNRFLAQELAALPSVKVILSLGVVSHAAVLRAYGLRAATVRFSHGSMTRLPNGVVLADSYHVSRYNTSTRRLTTGMFEDVVGSIRAALDPRSPA